MARTPRRLKGVLDPVRDAVKQMEAFKSTYKLRTVPKILETDKGNVPLRKVLFDEGKLLKTVREFVEKDILPKILERLPGISGGLPVREYRPLLEQAVPAYQARHASRWNSPIENEADSYTEDSYDTEAEREQVQQDFLFQQGVSVQGGRLRRYSTESVHKGFEDIRKHFTNSKIYAKSTKGGKRVVVGIGKWNDLLAMSSDDYRPYPEAKLGGGAHKKWFLNVEFGTGIFANKIRTDGEFKVTDPQGAWRFGLGPESLTEEEIEDGARPRRPQIWLGQRPANAFFEKNSNYENPIPNVIWRDLFVTKLPERLDQINIFVR